MPINSVMESPALWILVTLVAYEIGLWLSKKTKHPLMNPVLIAILLIITLLLAFKVPYKQYMLGGQWISFLLAPATVALAVPLYRQVENIKKQASAILMGIAIGNVSHAFAIVSLALIFKLNPRMVLTLLPKSVTTPIGMAISQQIGGTFELTVPLIVLTGVMGMVFGEPLFKVFGIKAPLAKGIAYGTASHALGTSKALEVGQVEGSMSSLAIGLSGLATALFLPLVLPLILKLVS